MSVKFVHKIKTGWNNFEARQRKVKLPWWGWVIAGVLLVCAVVLPRHMIISTTPSTDATFFWRAQVDPSNAVPGNYVTFIHTNPWMHAGEPILFVKRIGCGAGQTITRNQAGDFYCDETIYLGRALTEDSKGNPLTLTDFEGRIPEGMFFMTGDHPRSFDSKYYGLISYSELKEHAIPLF